MAKKKFDYFQYFKDVSDIICEAADHLYATLHAFDPETLQSKRDIMHEIEQRADNTKHEMMKLLAHEFITPIEREDIVSLAQMLDNVVDYIEDVLLRLYMFHVQTIRPDGVLFAEVIVKCAKELNGAMEEFKNFKHSQQILQGVVAVNNYESEGDQILIEGIRNLSVSDASDRELFVWTDIYEHLETCLDACEDVADIMEEVILKNT